MATMIQYLIHRIIGNPNVALNIAGTSRLNQDCSYGIDALLQFPYNTGYRRVIASSCNPITTDRPVMTNLQDTKLIPLTQGKFAIVDDEDYDWLMQWNWYYKVYAARSKSKSHSAILMHRLILPGKMIDHKNGNELDNRKCNLRECTRAENSYNQKGQKNSTSKYKGVHWIKKRGIWHACIINGLSTTFLGSFRNEEDAAKAYNEAAIKYFGEFARLNIIPS